MSGPYKVAKVQSHVSEDGKLGAVVIDRVIVVQKSPKDENQATNADNGRLTSTASTPDHVTEDGKRGNKDKEGKEYLVSGILRHVQKPEETHYVLH